MENKTMIWITTQKEGFHYWKDAPNEVGFLSNKHRHIFKFKIYISVFHNDRELEFFIFKKFIDSCIDYIWVKYGLGNHIYCEGLSCESISNELDRMIDKMYSKRNIIIEISEDGENGSYIEYNHISNS